MYKIFYMVLIFISSSYVCANKLIWPLDCHPGQPCFANIGFPDVNNNNRAFNCTRPNYQGHQGTDIAITYDAYKEGIDVYAAADGIVQWVFDGKYDNCPASHADCAVPKYAMQPGKSDGYRVCTRRGPYCNKGDGSCFWCFNGGNVVVIRHPGIKDVFATRYDHLKKYSLLVKPGQTVKQGQKIAEVASAGRSSAPHLHFEVWANGYYKLRDPWKGQCSPGNQQSLWMDDTLIKSLENTK